MTIKISIFAISTHFWVSSITIYWINTKYISVRVRVVGAGVVKAENAGAEIVEARKIRSELIGVRNIGAGVIKTKNVGARIIGAGVIRIKVVRARVIRARILRAKVARVGREILIARHNQARFHKLFCCIKFSIEFVLISIVNILIKLLTYNFKNNVSNIHFSLSICFKSHTNLILISCLASFNCYLIRNNRLSI